MKYVHDMGVAARLRRLIPAALVLAGLSATWPALANEWDVAAYIENDTHYRGEDALGNEVGLSKVRNTIQAAFRRRFDALGGFEFSTTLRATYDAVYDLNEDEYGSYQGGPIQLQSAPLLDSGLLSGVLDQLEPLGVVGGTSSLTSTSVPHGGGLSVGFLSFNSSDPNAPRYNPNDGFRSLGDRWHEPFNGGVAFGTPVRPCNIDSRGCADMGDYGNADENELRHPEFNDRLDFLRELTIAKSFYLNDTQELFVKVGRQQIVWGRTDLFRVLDVINPVDFSRNNIYDELQDIRYPMWIAQAEYRMGAMSFLTDANIQLVWNFDKFRPNNLGQCGTPNVILNAGCLFRGLKNLWDNGGTVANFAHLAPGVRAATDFGPGQIGIRNFHIPDWKLSNTQVGLKFEGLADGIGFSLNVLDYRSQLPALHGGKEAQNGFTGNTQEWPYLIAFDLLYPRVQLFGGSLDLYLESIKSAIRVEAAFTRGEQFANTSRTELYSEHHVFRSVVGLDTLVFIPFISTRRASLISGQIFYQHIFDHELEKRQLGKVGMPDWEHNAIATLLVKGWLNQDRVSPQLIQAYDFQARAYVVSPQVEWLINSKLKLTVGANIKTIFDNGEERWQFDDARSTNPWPPFTGLQEPGNPFEPGSRGQFGLEPLGVFRAGPIGTAKNEDEAYVILRYAFW